MTRFSTRSANSTASLGTRREANPSSCGPPSVHSRLRGRPGHQASQIPRRAPAAPLRPRTGEGATRSKPTTSSRVPNVQAGPRPACDCCRFLDRLLHGTCRPLSLLRRVAHLVILPAGNPRPVLPASVGRGTCRLLVPATKRKGCGNTAPIYGQTSSMRGWAPDATAELWTNMSLPAFSVAFTGLRSHRCCTEGKADGKCACGP